MSTLTIIGSGNVELRDTDFTGGGQAAVVSETGRRFLLRFKPVESTRTGDQADWVGVDRPGIGPLLLYGGTSQPEFGFTAWLHRDHYGDVEAALRELRGIARRGERVAVVGIGNVVYGIWRITSLSESHVDRDKGRVIEAEVDIGLSAVRDPQLRVARKVGEPKSTPAPSPKPATRTWTVKAGDTLWAIATKTYNDPYRWTDIAKANGVTDPRKLQIGHVLRLP